MRTFSRAAWLVASLLAAAPLAAQSLGELDAIADASASEEGGIALSLEQTERGDLLGALATLERVLALFPKSAEARFNHAMLLCWLDDPQGALAEFQRLEEDDYAPGALEQARANCAAAGAPKEPSEP
ncbi:MAG: tetratricopeptide repeat protein [Erythrobacter sp.]|jgi:Flp pilus assembly protein TadD|nr:tetratricopeptide repeat protein [Erythrobacter sp.]